MTIRFTDMLGYVVGVVATGVIILGIAAATIQPQPPTYEAVFRLDGLLDSHGSGVHVGNGMFVTAAHVVKRKLTLEGRPVTVLKVDEDHDMAVVFVAGVGNYPKAKMGCDRVVAVGDNLRAVGFPTTLGKFTSYGRASTEVREITLPDNSDHNNDTRLHNVFLGDFPVMPGMSGGGVFNDKGELVGITSAMVTVPGMLMGVPTPFAVSYFQSIKQACDIVEPK